MSNGFKWELSKWGDGTTRLAYWDSIAGKDVILILNADGTVDRSYPDPTDDDKRLLVRLDLVQVLRDFADQNSP